MGVDPANLPKSVRNRRGFGTELEDAEVAEADDGHQSAYEGGVSQRSRKRRGDSLKIKRADFLIFFLKMFCNCQCK